MRVLVESFPRTSYPVLGVLLGLVHLKAFYSIAHIQGTPGKRFALLLVPLQNQGYLYTEELSGNASA